MNAPMILTRLPYQRSVASLEDVPAALRDLAIWCAWRLVINSDPAKKPGKVPVSPLTGRSDGWTGTGC